MCAGSVQGALDAKTAEKQPLLQPSFGIREVGDNAAAWSNPPCLQPWFLVKIPTAFWDDISSNIIQK